MPGMILFPGAIAAMEGWAGVCGYVSGWDTDFLNELTSREAITSWSLNGTEDAYEADNEPVLDVAGACSVGTIALFPFSSSALQDAVAAYTLDSPVAFTTEGTYTLTLLSLAVSQA